VSARRASVDAPWPAEDRTEATPMGYLEFVQRLFVMLQEHPYGLIYYTFFLALWTMCCLPTTPVEIAAGFTWTPVWASAASSIGKTVGSSSAFALSRLLLLPLLSRSSRSGNGPIRLHIDSFFGQLGSAIRTRPFWTVGLIRAAPLPIALKNYGLGMMPELPTSVFMLMTFGVNVPFSVAWTLTGSSASSLQEAVQSGGAGSSSGQIIARVATAVTLLVSLGFVGRLCRDQLKQMRDAHRSVDSPDIAPGGVATPAGGGVGMAKDTVAAGGSGSVSARRPARQQARRETQR
jgi:uncharacterized membrane protein YdjX (TVP38/TMEM64 family)